MKSQLKQDIKEAVKKHRESISVMLQRKGPPEWESAKRLMTSELGTHLNTLKKEINFILRDL